MYRLILLSFNLLTLTTFAQISISDSILQVIQASPNQTTKLIALNDLTHALRNKFPDSALNYAQQAIQLAQQINHSKELARTNQNIGNILIKKGKFTEAKEHYLAALQINRATGDSLAVATNYQGLGNAYRRLGQYSKALAYHIRCKNIRETEGDSPRNIAYALLNIGNVYNSTKDYDKAIQHYQEVIRLYKGLNNWADIALVYNNIFAVLYFQGRYKEALPYIKRAIVINDSLGNQLRVAVGHSNLGEVYAKMQQHEEAYSHTQKALSLYQLLGDNNYIQSTLKSLGNLSLDLKMPQEAVKYLNQSLALAQANKNLENIRDTYLDLSETYASLNNYKEAYTAHQQFLTFKDSLEQIAAVDELNRLKTQYETEKIEKENTALKEKQVRQIQQRNFLITGLILLGLLALIVFWAMLQRRKAYAKLQLQKEERDRLYEQLKDTQIQLLQSEKMASIGQLTAGIAHELNNPIGFVSANASALKRDIQELHQFNNLVKKLEENPSPENISAITLAYKELEIAYLDEELGELVDGIIRGSERTRDLITSLRTFSRNITEEFDPADIHEGLDSTLTILNSYLGNQITVHKDYGELPLIQCQITKLNQVFLNILNNAIQYIDGAGEIFIKTRLLADQQIEIRIKDTGKGMSEEIRKRIFDPFFTTKEVGKGTGLGLSISYSIIEQHKGNIEVLSTTGQGSEFIIKLPI